MEWLEDVLRSLAPAEKAALAVIFIQGGSIPIPIPEEHPILKTIETMRSTLGDVKASLNALDGSLVRRAKEDGREYWHFRHPTVRDAFASLVGSDPELVDIYVAGVPVQRMMGEISCGEMNIEGVKILVPSDRFPAVLSKLGTVNKNSWRGLDSLRWFLSRRCSAEFLELYFKSTGELQSLTQEICLLHSFDHPLVILCRLHENNLLPEDVRKSAAERIRKVAMLQYSCEFLEYPSCGLLTEAESAGNLEELSDIVFSNQSEILDELWGNWDGESDPESEFSSVKSSLAYFEEYGSEEERSKAENFLEDIDWAVEEMSSEQKDAPEFSALAAEEWQSTSDRPGRNIFDDVDE